jgi:ATP-binding cassette subfamily F protein 3
MMSQEVLQEALSQYDGSIIVVSHNRHFADSFVNKVLEVKNGKAVVYDGDIRYYLSKIRESQEKVSSDSRMNMPPVNINRDTPAETARKISGKEARQEKALLRQKRNQKLGPLKKNLASMESEIEVLETQKLELEQSLADPELYNDQDAFTEKSKLYNQVGHRLTRCYTAWEDIQSKIDKLEEELL